MQNDMPSHQSETTHRSDNSNNKIYVIPEISIHYERWLEFDKMPVIRKSEDAYQILLKAWNKKQMDYVEHAYILLLNRANRVVGISNISKGGTYATIIDRKVIFGIALKSHASSIIIAHGHPSGNLQPSPLDIETTKALKEAGEILEIPIVDHLILTSESYYSFADEGIL
jgi:DNA repair protein RadC